MTPFGRRAAATALLAFARRVAGPILIDVCCLKRLRSWVSWRPPVIICLLEFAVRTTSNWLRIRDDCLAPT
jgi:hypothetical protein